VHHLSFTHDTMAVDDAREGQGRAWASTRWVRRR
jgi:hypothetical protein